MRRMLLIEGRDSRLGVRTFAKPDAELRPMVEAARQAPMNIRSGARLGPYTTFAPLGTGWHTRGLSRATHDWAETSRRRRQLDCNSVQRRRERRLHGQKSSIGRTYAVL